MRLGLRDTMRDVLDGWRQDLPPRWAEALAGTDLGFDRMDPELTLEPWEPVFPVRKGKRFLGAPKAAHIFHAFDGLDPDEVTCVVLGQDPYPCPAFSTGRAFEAGNVAAWRELEKMFSVSVRTYMQLIVAARTGDPSYAADTRGWSRVRAEIELGTLPIEPAETIADRWVAAGVLLLNSALTITRFEVAGDPHQLRGHLPLWRPFMRAVLRRVAENPGPVAFIGFGDQAAAALREAELTPETAGRHAVILREHPARGDAVLALDNPFVLASRHRQAHGAAPIDW